MLPVAQFLRAPGQCHSCARPNTVLLALTINIAAGLL